MFCLEAEVHRPQLNSLTRRSPRFRFKGKKN
jgi:hypothetical protein